MKVYDQLKDDTYWKEVDADKSFTDLHDELLSYCNQTIDNISDIKIDKLWWLICNTDHVIRFKLKRKRLFSYIFIKKKKKTE